MKILTKKKKQKKKMFFFFEIGNFFFKLGKKSPKSHWERGQILAPEDTKKIPDNTIPANTVKHLNIYIYLDDS